MADDLYFAEEAEPAVPARFDKLFRVLIVIAIVCLGSMLIWLLGVSPFRPFSSINISSQDEIAADRLLALAGISNSSSFFSTNAHTVERALMSISSIESVHVQKRFPDRLNIILESRRPAAMALATLNGVSVPVLFDSQGVIFQIGGNEISPTGMFPIVSGLVIDDPFLGMRLPPQFIPFFRELERIDMTSPGLLQAISEIKIDLRPFNSYDLILYPVHRRIRVRLSELNEDMLRYSLLMVDVLASREDEIDIIDFRSGIASYIPKEASL